MTAVGLKLLPILHTVSQWVSAKLGRILRADWNMLGLYLLVCGIWEMGLVRLETLVRAESSQVPDLRTLAIWKLGSWLYLTWALGNMDIDLGEDRI